jgi:hypothetical protein
MQEPVVFKMISFISATPTLKINCKNSIKKLKVKLINIIVENFETLYEITSIMGKGMNKIMLPIKFE